MVLAIALAAVLSAGAPTSSAEPLAPRWRDWLEHDVAAILSDAERDWFLGLQTDEERERFVEAFWAARNPHKGLKSNAAREEHERRLRYADQQFGRDGTRPGARSDRGRMYIRFGEPRDRRFFHQTGHMWPAELWFYQAPKVAGLPSFFYLLFFKPHGVGDYRLYSPLRDGPGALIGGFTGSLSQRAALVELKDIDPEIYRASITLDPGNTLDLERESPGLGSDLLLARLESFPNLANDTSWLVRLGEPRESVQTKVDFAQYPLLPLVFPEVAGDGTSWVHYEVLVPADRLELTRIGNRFVASLELLGVLKDAGSRTIRQLDEPIALDLSEEQARAAAAVPMAIQGKVAVVPGSYTASFLLRDLRSGRFGAGDVPVVVRAAGGAGGDLRLGPLLLAHAAAPAPPAPAGQAAALPFQLRDLHLAPLHERKIGPGERLWMAAQVLYATTGGGPGKLVKTLSVTHGGKEVYGYMGFLEPSPVFDGGAMALTEEIRLGDEPAPGEYVVQLDIASAASKALGQFRETVVLGDALPRPWTFSREADLRGARLEIANQLFRLGDRAGAIASAARHAALGDRGEDRLAAAEMLLALEAPEEAGKALEPMLRAPGAPPLAHVYAAAGLALRSRYAEAAAEYEKAIAGGEPKPVLLNALGEAYARAGKPIEARKAYERSLALTPDQPEVKRAMEALGG